MKHQSVLVAVAALLVAIVVWSCGSQSSSLPLAPLASSAAMYPGHGGFLNYPPDSALVTFGSNDVGSPYSLQLGLPNNNLTLLGNAMFSKERIIPREVEIAAGGSVTFAIGPYQQLAIYAPGTRAANIKSDIRNDSSLIEDLSTPVSISNYVINDPDNRVAVSPSISTERQMWTTPPGTFAVAGRYLIVSTIVPAFYQGDMYGWVIVK